MNSKISRPIPFSQHLERSGRADAALQALLADLLLATKTISREVNRAGLAGILGKAGSQNSSGDEVAKLDQLANDLLVETLSEGGWAYLLASEEEEDAVQIDPERVRGDYIVHFDPLDGSSNIDYNVSIGTIFGIFSRPTSESNRGLNDCLQPARNLVAAGYVLYGSSTMLVYSVGDGTHGFTLDPSVGEFLLSHPNIRIPETGRIYSINSANDRKWPKEISDFVESLKDEGRTLRYIGSLVADFHRNLLAGGIFLYPADCSDPNQPRSKLRLVYEGGPMAFLVEHAHGKATTGLQNILDIVPDTLHQKIPLILGSSCDVSRLESLYHETSVAT
jgi:fructose-1,6-bisphosphatase I